MDHVFFSWLAAQPYSVEVAISAVFVVVIAPVVLAGMAALASWLEQLAIEALRLSGLLDSLEREKLNLWQLRPKRSAPARSAVVDTSAARRSKPRSRTAS